MHILKTYGLRGTLFLIRSWMVTRVFYSSASLIMLPFDIRGRRNILWGSNFKAGRGCRLEAYSKSKKAVLIIGDNVQIHDYVHITATECVTIGNDVLMASKIYISDTSHGNYGGGDKDSDPIIAPGLRELHSKKVTIGDRVWLGEFVSVLPGVSIGEGTIVGANSVVSKSLPDNVIAVGNPAKPIKKFSAKTKIWESIK